MIYFLWETQKQRHVLLNMKRYRPRVQGFTAPAATWQAARLHSQMEHILCLQSFPRHFFVPSGLTAALQSIYSQLASVSMWHSLKLVYYMRKIRSENQDWEESCLKTSEKDFIWSSRISQRGWSAFCIISASACSLWQPSHRRHLCLTNVMLTLYVCVTPWYVTWHIDLMMTLVCSTTDIWLAAIVANSQLTLHTLNRLVLSLWSADTHVAQLVIL